MLTVPFIPSAFLPSWTLTPHTEPLQPPLPSYANTFAPLLLLQHPVPGRGHQHPQGTLLILLGFQHSTLIRRYLHLKTENKWFQSIILVQVFQEADAKAELTRKDFTEGNVFVKENREVARQAWEREPSEYK